MIQKIKKYFHNRKWHWWASNILFFGIIIILIVPSWRLQFSTMVNGLFLSDPSIEAEETPQPVSLNWEMIDLKNSPKNISDSYGKVVFINSWATWCGPCRAELPSMDDLYKKYGNQVDFYFISTESTTQLIEFNRKMNYDFPIFSSQYYPDEFNVSTIPTSFIINKKGEIVYTKKGTADWNSPIVHQFLNDLIAE